MLSCDVEPDFAVVAVLELEVEAHAVEGEAGAGGFGVNAHDSGFAFGCFASENERGFRALRWSVGSEE